MTLKDIIEALEAEDPNRILPVGFNSPHSYRGYYDQLGFEPATDISIGDMLAAARSALGATFQGYKGGDYTMSPYTDCWIAEYGHSGDNMIGPILLRLLLGQGSESGAVTREPSDIWQAVLVDYDRYEVDLVDLPEADSVQIRIVRRSAGVRSDDGRRLPGTYDLMDLAYAFSDFDDDQEVRTRFDWAQAMAAGLNAAEATT